MIYDLLRHFRDQDLDKLVEDSYLLKEGLYFRLHFDQEPEILPVFKKEQPTGSLANWFKKMDYYSSLVDMNKPIDPKKQIHSNNIFSLFMKSEVLKLTDLADHIERYFSSFLKPKKEDEEILREWQVAEMDVALLERNKQFFLERISLMQTEIKNYPFKGNVYIKLFIHRDVSDYQREQARYLYPRIFNKNDYNLQIANQWYGLSNSNMGTNAKKPFLEHRTTTFAVPFRIGLAEAIDARKIFLWLQGQARNYGYLVHTEQQFALDQRNRNFGAQYVHIEKSTGVLIDDYDNLPQVNTTISFALNNYLQLKDIVDRKITELIGLEQEVDRNLYNGYLIFNYYQQPKANAGKFSSRQVNLLELSKQAMLTYFRKFDSSSLRWILDRITLDLTKEIFKTSGVMKMAYALNLRFCLLEFFQIRGKEMMGQEIERVYESVKEKVLTKMEGKFLTCESEEEFYFAVGQLASYLISLSQAQKRTADFYNALLLAKTPEKIKKELKNLQIKYGHAIQLNPGMRFSNLLLLVRGYQCKTEKINDDYLLAGIASPNVIYYKEDK